MVRGGRSAESVAAEYEASPRAIRRWLRESEEASGRGEDGWRKEEREELQRLRRELRRLERENAFLKRAAAWFARETTSRGIE